MGFHGGRGQAKYGPHVLSLTEDYVDNYEKHGHAFPSITGLSLLIGVTRKTIHQWAYQCH